MDDRKRGLLQHEEAKPEWIMLEDITPQPQHKKYSPHGPSLIIQIVTAIPSCRTTPTHARPRDRLLIKIDIKSRRFRKVYLSQRGGPLQP